MREIRNYIRSTQNSPKKEENVIFGGRLAEYRYYDMDKVIESALSCVKKEFGNE